MYDRTVSVGKPLAVKNANYKADFQYATRVTGYILTSIGIWPTVFEGVGRYLPIIVIVLTNFTIYFAIVPSALHIMYDDENSMVKMKLFGLLSFATVAGMKHCALTFRRSTIARCAKHVEEDWKLVECELDREAMLKHGRIGRNLMIICACFMYTSGLLYHIFLPFMPNEDDGQFVDHNRTTRQLVYPTYGGFFESQKSPVFEFVFVLHILCEYIMYSATAGVCTLAALFATHACGQIEIMMSRLKDLADGKIFEDSSNVAVRFKIIVQRHLRVLGFAGMTERILQEVCLVEFVGSIFLICLLEYYCIADWNDSDAKGFTTFILLLISTTFNIFILCHIGELLMEKTSYIGEACYMIDWYRLPIETSRGLMLVMIMSCNPAKISAGRMLDISISTFVSVLKTSVACLSFLRTVVLK